MDIFSDQKYIIQKEIHTLFIPFYSLFVNNHDKICI